MVRFCNGFRFIGCDYEKSIVQVIKGQLPKPPHKKVGAQMPKSG